MLNLPLKTCRLRPYSCFRLLPFFIFLLTAFISALGSLQLGPVNGSVLRLSLNGRFRDARWLALGGSLPEFLYAGTLFGEASGSRQFAGGCVYRKLEVG